MALNVVLSSSVHGTSGRYITRLQLKETNINIDNNTSTVEYSLMTVFSGASGAWAQANYGASGSVTIDGKKFEFPKSAYNFNSSKTKVWKSGSTVINHNSDGKKKIAVAFSLIANNSYLGNASGSGSYDLEDIPRASTFTVNKTSINLGDTFTVGITPVVSSYSHRVQLQFGTLTMANYSDLLQAGTNSLNVTPSISDYAKYLTDNISGTMTVRVVTFNGSTKLGHKDIGIKVTIPTASVKPSVSIGTTLINGLAGNYLKDISSSKIKITATGKNGASIKNHSTTIKFADKILQTSNLAEFNSNIYSISENVIIESTVTDSRGVTNKATSTIVYHDYHKPVLSPAINYRVNESNQNDLIGNYSIVGGTAKFKNSFSNKGSMKVEFKPADSGVWTQVFTNSNIVSELTKSQRIPTESTKEYDLRITLTDLVAVVEYNLKIQKGKVVIHYHKSGNGVAFGKMSEKEDTVEFIDEWKVLGGRCEYINKYNNLDEIFTQGAYYNTSNADALASKNYPIQQAGLLEIFISSHVKHMVTQRYTTYTGSHVFIRTYYSNTWLHWILAKGSIDISNTILSSNASNFKNIQAFKTPDTVYLTMTFIAQKGWKDPMGYLSILPKIDTVGTLRYAGGKISNGGVELVVNREGKILGHSTDNYQYNMQVTFIYPY